MRSLRGPAAAAAALGLDARVLVLLHGVALAMVSKKAGELPLTPSQRIIFICTAVGLTLLAGLMSGLTLGLMSLDTVDLEVLKRSGTEAEQRYANGILPLVSNQHFLLVTLLLCNAVAMEALPLFLDRLADPVTAIVISVTAVLVFGEIFPQALCSRYGLAIGYYSAWIVRALMALTSPISWPLAKLLDVLLGADHKVVFRRTQLKALVDMHGADEGLGGTLTSDEVKVICGALDLTSKTARRSMTPLAKVFMLNSAATLTRDTMKAILASGHSRIPVHREGDRSDIIGLIIVKELLQYKVADAVPVANVRMRSLPRLSADTPMYDLLKLFQTGRSHMVVLTDTLAHIHAECEAAARAAAGDGGGGGGGGSARDSGDGDGGAKQRRRKKKGEADGDAAAAAAGEDYGGFMDGIAERINSGPVPFPDCPHDEEGVTVPVGIISIEDVIEELMQAEIVDETDLFVDNERSVRVNAHVLAAGLPAKLRSALQAQPGAAAAAAARLASAAAGAAVGARLSGAGGGAGVVGGGSGGGAGTLTVRKTRLRTLSGELPALGGGGGGGGSGSGSGGAGRPAGGLSPRAGGSRHGPAGGTSSGDTLRQPLLSPDGDHS